MARITAVVMFTRHLGAAAVLAAAIAWAQDTGPALRVTGAVKQPLTLMAMNGKAVAAGQSLFRLVGPGE